jgi:choline kinase
MSVTGRFHVVVLAAGVGSRLTDSTAGGVKWLVQVGDGRVADVHLDAFASAGATSVVAVVGHNAAAVCHHVAARERGSTIVIHNEQYATRNNWYSALLALEHASRTWCDEVTVLINSDLWAPPLWIEKITRDLVASGEATIAVDNGRGLTDEAMKVSVTGRRVTGIGKFGVADPAGEYVGILALPPAERGRFVEALHAFEGDEAMSNAWYEHAIQASLNGGMAWACVNVPDSDWVEIDTPEDLELARTLALSARG